MVAVCQSGLWTTSSGLACMEGSALITGGSTSVQLEAYGPGGMTKRMTDCNAGIGFSLDYLEGAVYLCGGKKANVLSNSCFRGEPNHSNKGIYFDTSFEGYKRL